MEDFNKHFSLDNCCRQMEVFSKLFACKILLDENIDLYSVHLPQFSEELNDFHQRLPEIFKCFQLLKYLPVEYDSIMQIILRWSETEFKHNKFLTELVIEESSLNLHECGRLKIQSPQNPAY